MTNEPTAGPLSGYRVLEVGSTIAGPFCGRMLADFGAEVIKVEAASGDPARSMGKQLGDKSLLAASLFRNKANISVDLRKPEGQDIVRQLAMKCDVLVENFKPGALERWGLGWEALSALHPGLVMVRISGFGQTGPYASRAGYGVIAEAVSGMRHLTGDPDRPPARVAISLTDYIAGLHAAFGAVMALMARGKTGRGQMVDAALYEGAFNFMEAWIPAYEKLGFIANRTGPRLAGTDPNNLYPTADDRFVHITAMANPIFRRLMELIGRPELADDERYKTMRARGENWQALDAIITQWSKQYPAAELEKMLIAADVPATRIFDMSDIFDDPHYKARGAIVSVPDDELGEISMAEVVPRLSDTPGAIRHAGHRMGADTRTVLRDLLDFDDARIDGLIADGIVLATTDIAPDR